MQTWIRSSIKVTSATGFGLTSVPAMAAHGDASSMEHCLVRTMLGSQSLSLRIGRTLERWTEGWQRASKTAAKRLPLGSSWSDCKMERNKVSVKSAVGILKGLGTLCTTQKHKSTQIYILITRFKENDGTKLSSKHYLLRCCFKTGYCCAH